MGGPGVEYDLKDCPKGQKDLKEKGKVLKVSIDTRGSCNKADICKIVCEHKKE